MKLVRKALLPVAGFGTRFFHANNAMPKEPLPIADKTLIQHMVRGAIAAGTDTLIFGTGCCKRAFE